MSVNDTRKFFSHKFFLFFERFRSKCLLFETPLACASVRLTGGTRKPQVPGSTAKYSVFVFFCAKRLPLYPNFHCYMKAPQSDSGGAESLPWHLDPMEQPTGQGFCEFGARGRQLISPVFHWVPNHHLCCFLICGSVRSTGACTTNLQVQALKNPKVCCRTRLGDM